MFYLAVRNFPTDTGIRKGTAGEYFYLQSKVLLDEVDELRRETIRIGQAEESKLRIGYLKNYSGQELHMALAEFSRLYPDSFIGTARWRRGILQG